MTFKQNWEKTESQHKISDDTIRGMFHASTGDEVESYEIVSGGCANLNIKVKRKNRETPVLLRIYLRDKEAAYREMKISEMLQGKIPIPKIYLVDDFQKYKFAICEFVDGITLRDLLLIDKEFSMHSVMYRCGEILAEFDKIKFPKAGFFDKDINIVKDFASDEFIIYMQDCLKQEVVKTQLGPELLSAIENLFTKNKRFFPDGNEMHLVHADFDPSNILVRKVDDSWQVVSVLDWEFAFSGSTLHDIANMLRYTHHMPAKFENSFIEGLRDSGIVLSDNWKITINLLNLGSLIDCLARSDTKKRPNQCQDIKVLIARIVDSFASNA